MRLRPLSLVLLGFALTSGAVAMANGIPGFGGDAPPARIPIPARDFTATVEDRGGTAVTVERVSFNGEVFLYGTKGLAQITAPFEHIREVRVEPSAEEGKVAATITFLDEASETLLVDGDIPCYGATPYGNYRIDVEQVRSIRFTAK